METKVKTKEMEIRLMYTSMGHENTDYPVWLHRLAKQGHTHPDMATCKHLA